MHGILICIIGCLLPIFSVYGAANETTYDQRQSGDYNIHISLKDIRIVALLNGGLGGSEDYDYNYDYSEMTIKPSVLTQMINSTTTTAKTPTTSQASTTTEKIVEITPPPHTFTSKPLANNKPNVTSISNNRPKPTHKPDHNIPVQIVLTPVEVQPIKNITSATVHNATKGQADCIEGFVKDREGNCRPRLKKVPQQTLLRKLIQLSHRNQHNNQNNKH